jgi:hypothetical protein
LGENFRLYLKEYRVTIRERSTALISPFTTHHSLFSSLPLAIIFISFLSHEQFTIRFIEIKRKMKRTFEECFHVLFCYSFAIHITHDFLIIFLLSREAKRKEKKK